MYPDGQPACCSLSHSTIEPETPAAPETPEEVIKPEVIEPEEATPAETADTAEPAEGPTVDASEEAPQPANQEPVSSQ